MVAIALPSVRESGLNYSAAVPATAKVGMSNDVLQEAMASSAAQEVWCCDEHACRRDSVVLGGDKNMDIRLSQGLLPNACRTFAGLGDVAHLRHS